MKILKILLILLVPAVGIVGCQKADTKPSCKEHSSSTSTTDSDNSKPSSRYGVLTLEGGEETSIVGSGEDDRDGGDKPKKVTGR